MKSTQSDAYKLIHEGAEALAAVEEAGMRVDIDYLDYAIKRTGQQIKSIAKKLRTLDEYKQQKERFGSKTNLTSRRQLATVLFDIMGHKPLQQTPTGRPKMDEATLNAVDSYYTRGYMKMEKLRKLKSTYLEGVRREAVDGFLHPFFNLHLVKTHRSSSDRPNFQNVPIRDPEIAKKIRRAYLPRDGQVLVEVDYSALEFRIAACFWKDPEMVTYASDSTKDIHRDVASEIWKCARNDVSKPARHCGKNMFVFPQLYGDFYINNARLCWEEVPNLKVGDTPMLEHLKEKGIRKLGKLDSTERPRKGTFEHHMKNVEDTFYSWFPHLSDGKVDWWNAYRKRGYFDLMTGFRITGVYSKNFVYNCPIQGPAFHLLLWSLTRMVKWMSKNKMRSKIVGQIHDSIVADVHKDELSDYLHKIREVMTVDVKKKWDWIITPLEVEAEMSETNWYEKKEIAID